MGLLGAILGKQRVQFIQNSTNTIIQFDASLKETHSRESPPTEFPVENGDTISDHVIVKPFTLELQGIISDTPIGDITGLLKEAGTSVAANLLPPIPPIVSVGALALFSALSDSNSPSVAAYNQLLKLQENALPFDVLTSLYRYKSMWIKSLSVPRDAENGKVLMFTVNLVQLILVQPQSVDIKIFANPGLSAALGELGQHGLGIPNGFDQGFTDTDSAIRARLPSGLSGGDD